MPAKTTRKVAPKSASKSTKSGRTATRSPLYEVRHSRIQGRGAFALRPIRKGQRVDEYVGQKISHEEADRRYDDNNGRHHTFLFVLDDDTVLDARYGGNDARYLNHSCDPNCESVIEKDRVWIKAIKAIQPETELVYDYRFEWQDEYEPEDIRYYACRCGSAKCRGTILMVPRYLKQTVRQWLAGEDVPKPRKPKKGARKSASKTPTSKSKTSGGSVLGHPHVAERHASKVTKRSGSSTKGATKKASKRTSGGR